MPAVIFNGAFVKTLKDNVKIGGLENIYLLTGDPDDPTAVAKEAPQGSLYWRSGTAEIYQKLDNGSSVNWSRVDGDIKGPGASTDNALVRWNGTTGLLVQDSSVLLDDSDNMSGINDLTVGNDIIVNGLVDGRDVSVDGATLDAHLDGDPSKHDATEIDYERVDGSKVDIQAASDDAESALTDLDDRKLSINGANTMAADLDLGGNDVINVGLVDGRDVSVDGTTLDTHLNGGPSKHDADEIDYERVDGSKKNIQPTSDEVESALTDLDDAIGSLDATPTYYTPASPTIVASHLMGIDNAIGNALSIINNFEWQPSALDYIVDNTLAPPTEVLGDRYVLSHDGGAPNAAWDGASAGDIVEFDGSVWVATTPTLGTFISVDDEGTSLRQWTGSQWSQKFFESTTASGFLSRTGFDIQLTDLAAQNIILGSASNVATSVDLSTLGDINGTTTGGLEIKTEVIDNANISLTAAIEFTKMEALTANRATETDASGFIVASAVTSTELNYLSGVTSDIQTQLDAKLDDFTSVNDNRLVRTDGITGEAIQESVVTLDDSGAISGITQLNVDNVQVDGNTISSTDVNGNIVLDPNGTGDIDASSAEIINVADPTAAQSAVTREYYQRNIYSTNSNSGTFSGVNFETHLVDTTGGAAIVNLPVPSTDAFIVIKDAGFNANTNNITVARNASENIEGVAANYIMNSDGEAKIFVSNGTDWFIL